MLSSKKLSVLDEEWRVFLQNQQNFYDPLMHSQLSSGEQAKEKIVVDEKRELVILPSCGELVISTKTKCLYLSAPVPIEEVFWRVPILPYWMPATGVVKKQTKIICSSPEEYDAYQEKVAALDPAIFSEKVIKFVDNAGYVPKEMPSPEDEARMSKTAVNRRKLKYKNERKITIGMCKKDVLNVRRKEKQGAFYNCVAFTLRILYEGMYYEFHAKIFNTGKIEVPGRMNHDMMEAIKTEIIRLLSPLLTTEVPLAFVSCKRGVLINSGFKCGFLVDRDKVHHLLKTKYGIETSYDSCSYQGVKSKFYFNHDKGFDKEQQTGRIDVLDQTKMKNLNVDKKYSEVAFMIFRTGSCIIVGNCSKRVLYFIYEFIRDLLAREYEVISMGLEEPVVAKQKKARKVMISCSETYLQDK